jgi:RuvB C-terminal winged helix domain
MLRSPRLPGNGKAKLDPVHTIVYHAKENGESWVEFNEGRAEIPLADVLEAAENARVIRVEDPEKSAGETILFGKRGSVPEEERAPEASNALRTAETIAATLRLDTRTVKTVLEPYLLEEGLIVRTARGREATAKAREVIEKAWSVEGEAAA